MGESRPCLQPVLLPAKVRDAVDERKNRKELLFIGLDTDGKKSSSKLANCVPLGVNDFEADGLTRVEAEPLEDVKVFPEGVD